MDEINGREALARELREKFLIRPDESVVEGLRRLIAAGWSGSSITNEVAKPDQPAAPPALATLEQRIVHAMTTPRVHLQQYADEAEALRELRRYGDAREAQGRAAAINEVRALLRGLAAAPMDCRAVAIVHHEAEIAAAGPSACYAGGYAELDELDRQVREYAAHAVLVGLADSKMLLRLAGAPPARRPATG